MARVLGRRRKRSHRQADRLRARSNDPSSGNAGREGGSELEQAGVCAVPEVMHPAFLRSTINREDGAGGQPLAPCFCATREGSATNLPLHPVGLVEARIKFARLGPFTSEYVP
jgi:hypothetical protein